ncbi:MAG: SLBB domain-containing protein, partial [Saprospiraceae bacterium]|nr:SLBB domain-containing protein [Saprospiraceae bacterium]
MALEPEDIIFIPSSELSKIYVLGAVAEPKFIFFRDGMKVLDAILEAGGFSEYAKENSVIVHRKGGDKLKVLGKNIIEGKDT